MTRDETSTSNCLVAIGAVIHPIRCPLGLEAIAIGRLVAARMLLAGASEVLLVDCRRDHIDCRLKFAIVQSTKGDIVSTPSSL
jgi:hypothetical protein